MTAVDTPSVTDFFGSIFSEGAVCAAVLTGGKMRHYWFDDWRQMADWAERMAPQLRSDTYFSFASYHDKNKRRKRVNVRAVKTFVFDIDVGKDGAYQTAKDAIIAFYNLVYAGKLPRPLWVVQSGSGLHIYWPLTEPMPVEQWRSYAMALREHLRIIDPKLAIDTTRVVDPVGLLRVPGTFNWKDPQQPKPVVLMDGKKAEPLSPQAWLQYITPKEMNATPAVPAMPSTQSTVDDALLDRTPVTSEELLSACPAFRHAYENRANAGYEEWWGVVQLCAFLEDGAQFVHAASQGHPGYSMEATNAKFHEALSSRSQGVGPFTCERFCAAIGRGDLCTGCQYSDVKSPIVAARRLHRQREIEAASRHAANTELSYEERINAAFKLLTEKFGVPLRIGDNGALYATIGGDSDGIPQEVEVIPSTVLPMRRLFDDEGMVLVEVAVLGRGGTVKYTKTIDSVLLGHKQSHHKLSALLGFVFPAGDPGRESLVRKFFGVLAAAANELPIAASSHSRMGAVTTYVNGTKKKGILFGDKIFVRGDEDGQHEEVDTIIPPMLRRLGVGMVAKDGSLDAAKTALATLLAHMRPDAQYFLLASPASMFLHSTGVSGAIVHMAGVSGYGKSTLLSLASAIMGDPKPTDGSARDTLNAIEAKLSMHNTMPYHMDEVTALASHHRPILEEFIYTVVNGHGRGRALRSGHLRDNPPEWNLIALTTGNNSLLSATRGGQSTVDNALAMRIVELGNDDDRSFLFDSIAPADAVAAMENLRRNHGHIGYSLVRTYVRNMDRLHAAIRNIWNELNRVYGHEHRFINAVHSCVLVTAQLLNNMFGSEVINMDIITQMRDKLHKTTKTVSGDTEEIDDPMGLLIDVIASQSSTTAIFDEENGSLALRSGPMDTVTVRVEVHGDVADIWFERYSFETAAKRITRGQPPAVLSNRLEKAGILVRENGHQLVPKELTLDVPNMHGAMRRSFPTRCYHFRVRTRDFFGH